MSAPEAQLCTFSSIRVHERGVDNLVDPGRVVHNLPNSNFMQVEASEDEEPRLQTPRKLFKFDADDELVFSGEELSSPAHSLHNSPPPSLEGDSDDDVLQVPSAPGPCPVDSTGPSCPTTGHQEDDSSDCNSGPRSGHGLTDGASSLPSLPQPDCIQWDPCLVTIFEVTNISSLVTFADHLLHRKAAVSFLQETSCSPKQRDFHRAKFC